VTRIAQLPPENPDQFADDDFDSVWRDRTTRVIAARFGLEASTTRLICELAHIGHGGAV